MEFESLSDGPFHCDVPNTSKKNLASLSAPAPCDNEPIADEEWVENYLEKKEKEKARVNAMHERLDEKFPSQIGEFKDVINITTCF